MYMNRNHLRQSDNDGAVAVLILVPDWIQPWSTTRVDAKTLKISWVLGWQAVSCIPRYLVLPLPRYLLLCTVLTQVPTYLGRYVFRHQRLTSHSPLFLSPRNHHVLSLQQQLPIFKTPKTYSLHYSTFLKHKKNLSRNLCKERREILPLVCTALIIYNSSYIYQVGTAAMLCLLPDRNKKKRLCETPFAKPFVRLG